MHGPRRQDDPQDDGEGESNRLFVVALIFVVVLAVAGIFLVRSLSTWCACRIAR